MSGRAVELASLIVAAVAVLTGAAAQRTIGMGCGPMVGGTVALAG